MGQPIGRYDTPFEILRRVTHKDPTYGEAESGWAAVGLAWGGWQETGGRTDDTGARRRGVADAVITLRGRVGLSAADRLRHAGTREVYRIDGVSQTQTETVCQGFRLTDPREPEA